MFWIGLYTDTVITKVSSRLSIRVSAPVLLVLPVLVAAGVLVAISAAQGRAAVERLASQQLAQIHDQIGQHVESLLDVPARVDRANIALLRDGRLDPATPRDWAGVLVEQFLAFEVLSAITWGGEDGQCTWVARYIGDEEHLYYAIKDGSTGDEIVEYRVSLDGVISDRPAGSFVFDPRTRPWYIAPKRAGEPAWSEPFLWVGGGDEEKATLGIAYGWPYFDASGEFIGVMDADLSLQDISRYLSRLRIGRTGRAYLIDEDGLLLASSTDAPLVDGKGVRLAASASDRAWISASSRSLDGLLIAEEHTLDHDAIITVDGQREWVRASTLRHHTGLNWTIVTVVPETDFTAEIVAGQRRSAWFTAGATLATLGLGIALAMLLVRPILHLSSHVRRLGEGELEQEIDLPYAKELKRLSDDINQMAADLRDRMELRRSLALAMEVQQSLLPSETPRIDGLDIAGHSTYCDETGGDYYDYLEIADLSHRAAAFAVGDVMGHGIAAAMLMATARGILRSRCTDSGSLGELLGHLNDLLVEVTGGVRFMTMALMTIDAEEGELRLASAGHDPPFLYDPERDAFIELEDGGMPLGIMAGEHYPEVTHAHLPLGSVVLLSTDGVWEAQNASDEQFGKDRVREILRACKDRSSAEIARSLHEALQEFCGDARQLDDITFVVAKRVALDPRGN